MTRRAGRSIWERLNESTEGPTVTLQIPRDRAEELMGILGAALEMDGGMDGMDADPGLDVEPDMDDMGGPPDGDADDMGVPGDDGMSDDDYGELGFSAGGEEEPEFAAGEPDEDDDEPAPPKKKEKPKKKGPGRPPKKDDDSDDDDSDDDDEEEQDEAASYGSSGGSPLGMRPKTALGESSFAKLARKLAVPRRR